MSQFVLKNPEGKSIVLPAEVCVNALESEKGRLILLDFHLIALLDAVERYRKKDKRLDNEYQKIMKFREHLGALC